MDYTKGEWKASIPKGSNGYWKVEGYNDEIAILYQAVPAVELEANAHLISSSPDMYEALKMGKDALKALLYEHPDDEIGKAQLKVIDKALSKAEGK